MSPVGRLAGVQHLRAAAALAVVAYHALQWRSGGFDIGRAGVDVFFVVSGLVLWRVAAGRAVSPRAFLFARMRRILPSYWLATLSVAAIAAISPAFLPQVRSGSTHLLLSLALVPHFDPRGLPFPTLPPGWTLCFEAEFYILFAAALALPRRWCFTGLIGSLAGVTAAGYVLRDPWFVLGANPMMLEFAAGVALGVLLATDRLPTRPWGWAMLAAGVAGFAVSRAPGVFTEIWRPLLWGGPATLVVAGVATLEARGGVPPWRLALILGDASYALYLVHLPTIALVAHLFAGWPDWIYSPLAVLASVAMALAFWRWVEAPLARDLRRGTIGALYHPHGFNRLDAACTTR